MSSNLPQDYSWLDDAISDLVEGENKEVLKLSLIKAIEAEVERVCLDVIGADETQQDHRNTDAGKTHNYAVVTRNDLRATQRKALEQHLKRKG